MREVVYLRLKCCFMNFIVQYFLYPFIKRENVIKNNKILHQFKAIIIKFIFKLQPFQKSPDCYLFMGTDNLNWSTDEDRKNAEFFLKINKKIVCNKLIKTKNIYCLNYGYLLREQWFWLRILKKKLDYNIIAVVSNDPKIEYNRGKIFKLKNLVDIWISPSKSILNYLKKKDLNVKYIPFYVDPDIFKPLGISKKELCNKLGLNYSKIKNKIIIGSFQRDTTADLKGPKWQKNPDLLVQILKRCPSDSYLLLLAGPRRHYIVKECQKYKIPYLFYGNYDYIENQKDDFTLNNHPLEIINLLYNLADIYIVSSLSEGGPKAVLEASLTRTLIFSTDVGLARDFLHKDLIFTEKNCDDILKLLNEYGDKTKEIEDYLSYNYKSTFQMLRTENYKKLFLQLFIQ